MTRHLILAFGLSIYIGLVATLLTPVEAVADPGGCTSAGPGGSCSAEGEISSCTASCPFPMVACCKGGDLLVAECYCLQ